MYGGSTRLAFSKFHSLKIRRSAKFNKFRNVVRRILRLQNVERVGLVCQGTRIVGTRCTSFTPVLKKNENHACLEKIFEELIFSLGHLSDRPTYVQIPGSRNEFEYLCKYKSFPDERRLFFKV